jgi:hypothetical protein
MSERVLVGPLLDFGRSFWNSPLLQDEFPGLESRGVQVVGKFGIGFFSVFQLGEQVKVASRRFDAGVADTRVLEFSSLADRPIIRAQANELPSDFSTRVSVRLKTTVIDTPVQSHLRYRSPATRRSVKDVLFVDIRQLVAALDVTVDVIDSTTGESYTHSSRWLDGGPENFLNELLAPLGPPERESIIAGHLGHLRPVQDELGRIYGRAALWMEGGPAQERH